MRRLRYCVAMSLDGYIAGPEKEYDWIVADPAIDFAGLFAQFDTLLMGRKTFEVAWGRRKLLSASGQRWVVVSETMRQQDYPDVTVLGRGFDEPLRAMKAEAGKDIWLFGGGRLFRSLMDAGVVDMIEVQVMPVLLGSGVPLLAEGQRVGLRLVESLALASGILTVRYAVRTADEQQATA